MATLREEIAAKIKAIREKAKADTDALEKMLKDGGTWLDQEATQLVDWATDIVAKVREKL